MDCLAQDIRHGFARLVRDRSFAAVTIFTLALGIGANTAVFSLVQAVLLRPLPYSDPDRLIAIWGPDRAEATHLSLQEVVNYGRDAQSLAAVAGYQEFDANLTGGQEPERVRAGSATPNLFEVLGASAMLGRVATPADVQGGSSDVIVIGHGLWQRRFGGAASVVGTSVQVNGRARTVIGVMPPSFQMPNDYLATRPTEAWVPEVVNLANLGAWGSRSYSGIGRLRDGVSPQSASSELPLITERWVKAGYVRARPDGSLGGLARRAIPVEAFVTGGVRSALLILVGAVAFVLLIACANVANLQLARADVRRREVAVRAALGAGRGQIIRHLLTESVMLGAIGGIAGVAVAWAGLRLVIALGPNSLPRVADARLDVSVTRRVGRVVDRDGTSLRTTAGAAVFPLGRHRRTQGWGPHGYGRAIPTAGAPVACGPAARLLCCARPGCWPADPQPDRVEQDRPWLQSRPCVDGATAGARYRIPRVERRGAFLSRHTRTNCPVARCACRRRGSRAAPRTIDRRLVDSHRRAPVCARRESER